MCHNAPMEWRPPGIHLEESRPVSSPPARSFAQQLRSHREAAGLSQAELARRAGIRRSTVNNLERGRTEPSAATLQALAGVEALAMPARFPQPPPALSNRARPELSNVSNRDGLPWSPRSHYAPTYEPLKHAAQMEAFCNGPGGALDQVYLYLDHQSAADWLSYCSESRYVRHYRDQIPLDDAAVRIAAEVRQAGLDVVALGPGDGRTETRLVELLAERLPPPPDLRLYLLDISHCLLHRAFRHAADALAHIPVGIYPIHGDFYHLPSYEVLTYRAPRDQRVRVWTLLGHTVGNLLDEARYLADLHACARPGDFALFDVQTTFAPAADLAAVQAADPALQAEPPRLVQQWLTGPLRRHCRPLRELHLRVEVSNRCPVPGSYQLQFIGTVTDPAGVTKRFELARGKRYDLAELSRALSALSWDTVDVAAYGPMPQHCARILVRRR